MRILHACLSCFYIDGFAYQENRLVEQHVAEGHEVLVVASTESFGADKNVCYLAPGEYMGTDGARVIRLPYRRGLPALVARKLRSYPGVAEILSDFRPDVILFHGMSAWELRTFANYARHNPSARLFVDSHEDFNNSARTLASRWVLHWSFYRWILRSSLDSVQRVLCISQDCMAFARCFYGVPEEKLEFFPLGGRVFSDEEYEARRANFRNSLGLSEDLTVFAQSGKFDKAKRLVESVVAFTKTPGDKLRLILAGQIMPDVEPEVRALIDADKRIIELGWLKPAELEEMLCGADVYVQPGSQSATMQMSLCCRCAVILDDVPSHRIFVRDNGALTMNGNGLAEAIARAGTASRVELNAWAAASGRVAAQLLDYRQLAARIY